MSLSRSGPSGPLFRGTAWSRQLVVVKYSATGEMVEDAKIYDEENLDQVIHAIGGDGTIAELECYRHPLLEVFPNARVTPAVGFESEFIALKMKLYFIIQIYYSFTLINLKDWVRGLKYPLIDTFKPFNDDQKIEKVLNGMRRTDPVLYHSFVVFKVIQKQEINSDSTKEIWCSIEKNTTCGKKR